MLKVFKRLPTIFKEIWFNFKPLLKIRRTWILCWKPTSVILILIWMITTVTSHRTYWMIVLWNPISSQVHIFRKTLRRTALMYLKCHSSTGPSIDRAFRIYWINEVINSKRIKSSWTSFWVKCTKMFCIQRLIRRFYTLGWWSTIW